MLHVSITVYKNGGKNWRMQGLFKKRREKLTKQYKYAFGVAGPLGFEPRISGSGGIRAYGLGSAP